MAAHSCYQWSQVSILSRQIWVDFSCVHSYTSAAVALNNIQALMSTSNCVVTMEKQIQAGSKQTLCRQTSGSCML